MLGATTRDTPRHLRRFVADQAHHHSPPYLDSVKVDIWAPTRREDPDLPARLTRSPGRTRRAWGYRWLPSLWSSRILLQCAAAAPRPRCRRPVVTVRVDRRQRGGPFIAGCAGGYARTTPRHAWACGAGRGLRTRPLGGRRAAARHLGSSSAGMQPGAPRASSARSPSFPSLGNGRQR